MLSGNRMVRRKRHVALAATFATVTFLLATGCSSLQESANLTILLTSDGNPNCGAAGTSGHLTMILNANTQGAAIHTFGIQAGGIFRQFLIDVAAQTGGTYTDVP